jgi:hypothetical protein
MFKSSLSTRLSSIFDIRRVSFDEPGDTREQDKIFVEIDSVRPQGTYDGKKLKAVINGKITIFAQSKKLPFGFFQKKLYNCNKDMQKDLFFYNFDNNVTYLGAEGLTERSCNFQFNYTEDFDPDKGYIEEFIIED